MKIEHLKYFLEVARTGSIHKTADELFLTPQNLGLIIKSLEKEIGEDLFIRTSKGMRLTAEGEKFIPYAREIVAPYDRYFSNRKKTSNILKLYTTPALAKEVRELQEIRWGGRYYLSVQKKSPDDLIEMLHKGVEGIYFLSMLQRNLDLLKNKKRFTSLFTEDITLMVCHRENSILKQKNLSLDVLNRYLSIQGEAYNENSEGIEKNAENQLQIDDTALCKKMMKEQEAVYTVLSHLFYKNFQEQDEWEIVKEFAVPPYEFVLIYNNIGDMKVIEEELSGYMKKLFIAE